MEQQITILWERNARFGDGGDICSVNDASESMSRAFLDINLTEDAGYVVQFLLNSLKSVCDRFIVIDSAIIGDDIVAYNKNELWKSDRRLVFSNTFSVHIFCFRDSNNSSSAMDIRSLLHDLDREKWYYFCRDLQKKKNRELLSEEIDMFICPDGPHESNPGLFFSQKNENIIINLFEKWKNDGISVNFTDDYSLIR